MHTPRLPRNEATITLHKEVIKAADAAFAWNRESGDQPPRFALGGEAGLGKTVAVIKELSKERWKTKTVFYAAPSLQLADELKAKMEKAGITAFVVRGRTADNPAAPMGADGKPTTMCLKDREILDKVSARSENVGATLCRRRDENGSWQECPLFEQCGYQRQAMAIKAAKADKGIVLIGSHAYLQHDIDLLKEESIDFVVIDESFDSALPTTGKVDALRFFQSIEANGKRHYVRPLGDHGYKSTARDPDERAAADAEFSAKKIEDATYWERIKTIAMPLLERAAETGAIPPVEDFRAVGLTPEDCAAAAKFELSHLADLPIHPAMNEAKQLEIVRAAANDREAYGFRAVWLALKSGLERDREGPFDRLAFLKDVLVNGGESLRHELHAYRLKEPRYQNTPLLILDAHADRIKLDRLYEGTSISSIRAEWRGVTVYQVYDTTGSKSGLEKSKARRDDILDMALEAADAQDLRGDRRPVVITLKAIEDIWIEEGRAVRHGDGRVFTPCGSVEIAHFGAIRGLDYWKDTGCLVVGGRIELSVQETERLAASWAGDEETPLAKIAADAKGAKHFPRQTVERTDAAGRTVTNTVSHHPDERADAILWGVREAEVEQAIARARLVHRDESNPCVVYIMTNIPLDIPVDYFVTWNELAPDNFRKAFAAGFVPASFADLARAHGDLFPTANAARMAASRLLDRPALIPGPAEFKTAQNPIESIIQRCAMFDSRPWVFVGYKSADETQGNRKKKFAFLRVSPMDDETSLRSLVEAYMGPLTAFWIERATVTFETAPEAAEGLSDAATLQTAAEAIESALVEQHEAAEPPADEVFCLKPRPAWTWNRRQQAQGGRNGREAGRNGSRADFSARADRRPWGLFGGCSFDP